MEVRFPNPVALPKESEAGSLTKSMGGSPAEQALAFSCSLLLLDSTKGEHLHRRWL